VPDGDGIDFGFDVESAVAGGCSTNGGFIYCSGVEHGQLGQSNGCDATPLTNVLLQLP
jgi:hypothetical protein